MKNLDLLVPTSNPDTDTWRWATVTAISPLRIRFDGDIDPLELTPDNTAGTLLVGDRVWSQITGKRVIVLSRATGPKFEAGDREPVGKVAMYVGDTPPTGYLLCDGGTFDSGTYPELASLVGDRFGVHSGTTYYLPDLRKRVAVGKGGVDDADFDTIGKSGGAKTKNLSHQHYMDHQHIVPSHQHAVYLSSNYAGGGTRTATNANMTSGQGDQWSGTSNRTYTDNPSVDLSATSVMQPYVVLNFIVRAAA